MKNIRNQMVVWIYIIYCQLRENGFLGTEWCTYPDTLKVSIDFLLTTSDVK